MENALKIENLSKRYPGFTLDNINITLPSGCIMGYIGENGAGKSTTIKLILDLIKRDGGRVAVLGEDDPNQLKMVKEHIGVVLDESCFPENLKLENVDLIMNNIYRTWDQRAFFDYAERFSLPRDKKVKDYSHGMKMKLTIAAALSHDSRLLILDEATSGLDPIVREEILDVFLEFIQDEGHSVFISSHIISDLEKICDYITFIHQGKILFSKEKDLLLEEFGILKCTPAEFDRIDKSLVVGYRKNDFGVNALVRRNKVLGQYLIEKANIEDIMLYHIKERKNERFNH